MPLSAGRKKVFTTRGKRIISSRNGIVLHSQRVLRNVLILYKYLRRMSGPIGNSDAISYLTKNCKRHSRILRMQKSMRAVCEDRARYGETLCVRGALSETQVSPHTPSTHSGYNRSIHFHNNGDFWRNSKSAVADFQEIVTIYCIHARLYLPCRMTAI